MLMNEDVTFVTVFVSGFCHLAHHIEHKVKRNFYCLSGRDLGGT